MFRKMVFSRRCCDAALLSWAWVNICPAMERDEFLLVCTAFALPIRLSVSQPMSCLTFTLSIISSHPISLLTGVKPQQSKWNLEILLKGTLLNTKTHYSLKNSLKRSQHSFKADVVIKHFSWWMCFSMKYGNKMPVNIYLKCKQGCMWKITCKSMATANKETI